MSESKRMRDKATDAFRRWARAGRPVGRAIRADGSDTEADFRACAAVFALLEKQQIRGRENSAAGEIRRAVEEVYMREPERSLRKLEVTLRVRRIAVEGWISERQVYAWLAKARSLWWKCRK